MEEHIVKILETVYVTHDVKRFRVEKPAEYSFVPGQATEVSIAKSGWRDEKRPFTFTCLPDDPYLEFTIKIYPLHHGVTNELGNLNAGDELIIRDTWGAITYSDKGVFIAGGAGITPFISIFRYLKTMDQITGNILIFANKTKADIILENEFKIMLGEAFINILSQEKTEDYAYGWIQQDFLKAAIPDFNKKFYVCGPPPMMDSVLNHLSALGVKENSVTLEL